MEFGEDKFATRSVRLYENGYLTRYDRNHWEDSFGSLPDFRFGKSWKGAWGEPNPVTKEEFEFLWLAAKQSPPYKIRGPSPEKPCIWIELYESGKWEGQS